MKIRFFLVAGLILASAGATGAYELRYPPTRWIADRDRQPFSAPRSEKAYDPLEAFRRGDDQNMVMFMSAAAAVSAASTQHVPGMRMDAVDTNNFDEAADSSWFENRIGRFGPRSGDLAKSMVGCAPDMGGRLLVRGAVMTPDAPALLIEDSGGSRFVVHFDPFDKPGSVSAPATAAALILWQAGYHVAPQCPVTIDRKSLDIAPGAKLLGEYKRVADLDEVELKKLLGEAGERPAALAMRLPEGRPFGVFAFSNRRYTDHNDRLRHQVRRALRGLRVFAAFVGWVNINTRATLDSFVDAGGAKGYMMHHLFNLTEVGEAPKSIKHSELGRSDPNGAFLLMTPRDGFWAAAIIARFDDPAIGAIVSAARFPDAASAGAAAQGLTSRRDALLRYWFGMFSPLTDFAIADGGAGGGAEISCTDLAVIAGIADASKRRYRFKLATLYGKAAIAPWQEAGECRFRIPADVVAGLDRGRTYELQFQAKDVAERWWLPQVDLFVKEEGGALTIEGLARSPR